MKYQLHNCRGEYEQLACGLLYIHHIFFADDGFGNYIESDVVQFIHFFS